MTARKTLLAAALLLTTTTSAMAMDAADALRIVLGTSGTYQTVYPYPQTQETSIYAPTKFDPPRNMYVSSGVVIRSESGATSASRGGYEITVMAALLVDLDADRIEYENDRQVVVVQCRPAVGQGNSVWGEHGCVMECGKPCQHSFQVEAFELLVAPGRSQVVIEALRILIRAQQANDRR
jgi:hypothetical protein